MNLNASGKECKCLHNMLTQHIQENVLSVCFGLLLFCMGLICYHVARQHTSIPLLSWYAIRCTVGDTSFAWHNLPGPAACPVDAHKLRVNLGGKLLETQCCSGFRRFPASRLSRSIDRNVNYAGLSHNERGKGKGDLFLYLQALSAKG